MRKAKHRRAAHSAQASEVHKNPRLSFRNQSQYSWVRVVNDLLKALFIFTC